MSIKPGYYNITSRHSQKLLNVFGSSCEPGTYIIQYHKCDSDSEKFLLIPCGDDYYYIQAKHSGLFFSIDIYGPENGQDNAKLIEYPILDWTNEKFKFIKTSSGDYKIQCKYNGKFLTVKDGSLDDEAQIVQFKDDNLEEQIFNLNAV